MEANQLAALAALANGIIPADELDAGAAAVQAGPRIAERMNEGTNTRLYADGLAAAERLARDRFAADAASLSSQQVHELLGVLREQAPAFFKQLRTDVTALYLNDPAVWQRIGFAGPSAQSGGHPDFDRPQRPPAPHSPPQ